MREKGRGENRSKVDRVGRREEERGHKRRDKCGIRRKE